MLSDACPRMDELKLLKTRDGRDIRVVTEIAGCSWQDMAYALNFSLAEVGVISKNNPMDVESACADLLSRWLEGGHRQPVSWRTIVNCLRERELNVLASQVHDYIQDCSP